MAVGQGGIITTFTTPLTQTGSITPTQSPGFIGQADTLQAPAIAGATYQWFFNGTPLAGATSANLSLPSVQTANAGTYLVAMTAGSVVTEYTYQLTVNAFRSFSPNLVDASFINRGGFISSVVPLAGGKVLALNADSFTVNGHSQTGVERLNADGTVDGSFDVGAGVYGNSASLPQALVQPDGKVVLWGTFTTVNTTSRSGAVRLNGDGSIDSSFAPDPALFAEPDALVLLPTGEFWLISASGGSLTWRLLTSTGGLDAQFGSAPGQTPLGVPTTQNSGTVQSVYGTLDQTGGCWVVVSGNNLAAGDYLGDSQLYRFTAAGALDPAFNQARLFNTMAIQQLCPSGNGMMYAGVGLVATALSNGFVGRFNPDGSSDPTWPQRQLTGSIDNDGSVAALLPDGSAITFNATQLPNNLGAGYVLQHITATDQIDPNFGGILAGGLNARITQQLFPLGTNQILVCGSFGAVNGVPTADVARLTLDYEYPLTRLVNLSVLGQTGAQPLSLGFVVGGSGAKDMLLRASGPALAAFGVPNAVADPQLTLFQGATPLQSNDNWGDNGAGNAVAAVSLQVGAFAFPAGSKDAALVTALPAGDYSIQATAHGSSGAILAELYDSDAASASASTARLLNFSVLTTGGSGAQTLTAGFVIGGSNARRVLIRADGPALTGFGIADVLPDPALTLFSGSGSIQTNSGWSSGTASDPTLATSVGAFALPQNSLDSAVLAELPAGSYTAQVTSTSGDSGAVLLEVYELP
jgi:uncharacterized delta-60 repeat protein